MAEFDMEQFIRTLQAAPEHRNRAELAEHSEYLQTHVFDVLRAGEEVDLRKLDWDAFEMAHVTPAWHSAGQDKVLANWLKSINRYFRKTPALSDTRKRFF